MIPVKLSFIVCLLASLVLADISLVLPGFDPQPLSAQIVGVGADNMTTYLLVPGQATGTFSGQSPAFTGTATLVENADNVVFEYANSVLTVLESCSYANGIAECAVGLGGAGGTTWTAQDTVTPLDVQGGGTASSVLSSLSVLATSSSLTTGTAAPGSSVPVSSATSSGTVAGPTQTNAGVRAMPGGGMVAILGVVLLL